MTIKRTLLIILVALFLTGCTAKVNDKIKLFGVIPIGKIEAPDDDPLTPGIEGEITTKIMGFTTSQVQSAADLGGTLWPPLGWIGTLAVGIWGVAERFSKSKIKEQNTILESNYDGFKELVNAIEKFKTRHPEEWGSMSNFLATKLNAETDRKIAEAKDVRLV